jgi:hypothetical protein
MQDILDRLNNWGRSYRVGYLRKTCGSAEKYFRSNWRQWQTTSEIHAEQQIDHKDAKIVEEAWARLSSDKHKQALRWHFIHQSPYYVVARKAGVKAWQAQELLGNAIATINSLLTSFSNISNISSEN